MSFEFWLRFEPQICPTRLETNFLLITAMADRKVRLCLKLFWFFSWVNTHLLDLKFVAFCPEFSGYFCVEFQEKTILGEFFRIFHANQGYDLPKFVKFHPTFYNFYSAFVFRWKKFTQVLSYVVCTQVRKHIHKRITKRRYREEKPRHFVFGKPVLFTLGLRFTTPYSLGVLVWNFYQTFVTVSIELWLRFEPEIRSTRLETIFLLITSRAKRKVRLCMKLFDFFRGWILIRLTRNLSRFVPNSVEILTWNFRKKLFWGIFSEIFVQTKAIYHLPKLVKFRLLSVIFILRPYCAEKIHTSTFICCLHPGEEARP